LPADPHELSLPALAPEAWKVTTTASLPPERATTRHVASWPASSKAGAGSETRHVVAPGECMWTLAHEHGYDQDALWSANPSLKEQGRLPNVLAPGDIVVLPARDPAKPVDVRAGTRVTIEVKAVLPRARLYFQDAEGKPRAGLGFVARVVTRDGTEHVWEGTTNGDGGFDESVPADSRTLDVVLKVEPEPRRYHFRFGHLDPSKTMSGVQGRLRNLGYDCGEERGELGPLTRRSLRDFQAERELPSTGTDDDATRSKLETLYKR
jgi:N-acetylmuramoyl-L-alanine amidase